MNLLGGEVIKKMSKVKWLKCKTRDTRDQNKIKSQLTKEKMTKFVVKNR